VITRTIRGKPDEELNGFLTQPSASKISSMMTNVSALSASDQALLDYYLNATADGTLDSEPDIYNFNFGGYSGQFVMDKNGNITVMPLQNISFTFYVFSGQTTYIQSFTAKTADGNTYYFGTDNAIEYTHIGNVYHAMSWYLYKIVSPSFHEIDFTYVPESYSFPTAATQSMFFYTNATSNGNKTTQADNLSQGALNYFTSVKLNKITFENGSLQVYSANPRLDINSLGGVNGAKVVDTIAISSGSFNKLYKFYYLNSSNTRLRLDSLIGQLEPINGTSNYKKEKYSFTYNSDPWNVKTGNFSFLYSQDYWGFYNGKINAYSGQSVLVPATTLGDGGNIIQLPGANRAPDEASMFGGILTQITYPTGGYTQFTYEANTESNKDVGGTSSKYPFNHFVTTISSDPQYSYYNSTPTQTYYYNNPSNYHSDVKLPIQINGPSQAPMNVKLSVSGLVGTTKIAASLYQVDSLGNTTAYSTFDTPNTTMGLKPGLYWLELSDPTSKGDSLIWSSWVKYTVTASWDGYTAAEVAAMKNNYVVGGLRIQQIADYDNISNKPINIKAYRYLQPGTTYSSGWLGIMPVYSYNLGVEFQVLNSGGLPQFTQIDTYFSRSSTSNYPLSTTQGCVVGYSHVEELLGANGENGKNEYFYTNEKTNADLPNQGGAGFPFAPPEYYDWHRGLLLKETTWKSTGNGSYAKVNEKASNYTTIKFNVNNYGIKAGFNPKPFAGTYDQHNSYYANPLASEFGRVVVSNYLINTDHVFLSSDTTRVYDQNDPTQILQTISNYQIDTSTYQFTQVQTTNSKNEKIVQTVTYPNQYNAFGSTGVASLQARGITTYPIEEITQKSNADGSNLRTVKAVYTTYKLNQPFRDSVYEMYSVAGIPIFQLSTAGPKDSHYQPVAVFNTYDTYGNILQEGKVGDAKHTYIWGYNSTTPPYNNSYPIAEVINADTGSVAYTNFEQLRNAGNKWGNWIFNYAGITTDATAPMGAQCYTVSSSNTISRSSLNSASKYVVSLWSKSGAAITVTGGTVTNVATGNAKNGWIYHECSISGATSVTIGGTGTVDELRLYPSTAQMSTYTYIPLVGMASKCDAKNDITYYVYDNVGRLIQVLDQNQNVVKQYQYNYANSGH